MIDDVFLYICFLNVFLLQKSLKPLIEEEQTIQWSNEKEQKDTLNDPQNITQNTKDWTTRISQPSSIYGFWIPVPFWYLQTYFSTKHRWWTQVLRKG